MPGESRVSVIIELEDLMSGPLDHGVKGLGSRSSQEGWCNPEPVIQCFVRTIAQKTKGSMSILDVGKPKNTINPGLESSNLVSQRMTNTE